MKDLFHNIGVVHLLDAQDTADTDTKSKLIDLKGFEGAVVILNVGAITGVDGSNYLTPKLQHCDTTADTSFADCAASDMLGAFTMIDATTEDQVTQMVGYIGNKRYIRVFLDFTGTAITACLVSVDGLVGRARREPVVAPAAVSAT